CLVHGDEAGLVERAEEERLPALRAGLDRSRVEVVRPAVPAQVPQVEDGGQREQSEQRRASPPGIGQRPAQQPPGPVLPGPVSWCLAGWCLGGWASGGRCGRPNTQNRYSRNLMTVAARLAAIRTETSASRLARAEPSMASEPEVRARPM